MLERQQRLIISWNPRWFSSKESTCQYRRHKRHRFDPWVRKILQRRKWQCTAVSLPRKFHEERILMGCSRWGQWESDTTEFACITSWSCIKFLTVPKGVPSFRLVLYQPHCCGVPKHWSTSHLLGNRLVIKLKTSVSPSCPCYQPRVLL